MPRSVPLAGGYNVPDYPNFDWTALEKSAQLTFTDPQRTALVGSMHRYLKDVEAWRAAALPKDVRARLQSIHKHASTLVNLLRLQTKNTPGNDYRLNLHHAVWSEIETNIAYYDPSVYIRLLTQLRNGSERGLTRLRKEGQPGREDKEAFDEMLRAWHAVYVQAGGIGRGCTRSGGTSQAKGPLLDLIEVAFQQIEKSKQYTPPQDGYYASRDALAQRIIIALKTPRGAQHMG